MFMLNKKPKFYFHIHHDILVEPLTEPLKRRITYIKESKPKNEIELRLKLLKPVRGKLPSQVVKAGEALAKAGEAHIKAGAWEDRGKAGEAFIKAEGVYLETLTHFKKQIEALHKKECPSCPWDGESIFPKKEK